MSMAIETTLSQESLNVLSDYYIKFQEAHKEENISNYVINYKYYRTGQTYFNFFNNYSETTGQFGDFYNTSPTLYQCKLKLRNPDTGDWYTSETFDFESVQCSTSAGSYTFPKTYISEDNNNTYNMIASNLYSDNYLDYERWTTLEIEPSPSPSPEPEEPTGNGFDSINPYFWVLPSFLLMLIFMYKFLDKIFARGD